MRMTLFATAAAVVAMCGPAFAQPMNAGTAAPATSDTQATTGARPGNEIGTGNSLPTSSSASNIERTDTRADIAPRLPTPPVGDNAGANQYLAAAQQALQRNRTGEAQEALERAETRLLDRATAPGDANTPDQSPRIQQITDALTALGKGDKAAAIKGIQQAMSTDGDTASGAAASMTPGGTAGSGAPTTTTN